MFCTEHFPDKNNHLYWMESTRIHETADGQRTTPHLITLKLVSNHEIRLCCLFSHILYRYAFRMPSLGISCKPRNLFLRLMIGPNGSFWANFGRLTSKIAIFQQKFTAKMGKYTLIELYKTLTSIAY